MTVVVIGAAGDLGGRVTRALLERDVPMRALVRRPVEIAGLPSEQIARADLTDRSSLDRAFAGADALFLVSSPTRDLAALETNAIDAAEAAGLSRIVKVSNIQIAGLEHGLHGEHRAVERRLATSPVAATVLQPSFFSTVMERQRELIARGRVVLPFGGGRIAWIDPDDIAAVAAVALTGEIVGPLRLTGPEALDGDEVAARLGVTRADPPLDRWRTAAIAGGLDAWLADSTVALYEAVARGALATVSPDVERVLGQPPRQVFGDGVTAGT